MANEENKGSYLPWIIGIVVVIVIILLIALAN